MLIDNINLLRKNYRSVREYFRQNESNLQKEPVQVVNAKSGSPTLQVESNGKFYYLHSKYNPEQEAEQIVGKYEDDVSQYDHVFFYGLGLGYHVEAFLGKHPDIDFTLYEPVPANFYHYMCHKKLDDLPLRRLKNLFVETSVGERLNFLNRFAGQLNGNILLVVLPSYERLYPELYKGFINDFKEHVRSQRSALHTDLAFEKRWTFNSVMNFPEVLKTPNILHDVDKDIFKDKPAIIVSAGPSLNEELENLRYIKENGLAYIFSVGSAINALLKNGIFPHATFSYDPSEKNQYIFEEIPEEMTRQIPLVFGSSVGFETLQKYKGIKLHMLTTQDSVSSYYLEKSTQYLKVNDASSIAVITLQVLFLLGFNPIILVGQNLAYKSGENYADGSKTGKLSYQATKIDKTEITVESTDGKQVYTNELFIQMRKQMEMYILHNKNTKVINTTVGGAKIEGTQFRPLSNVIAEILKTPVVQNGWFKTTNHYDINVVRQRQSEMAQALNNFQTACHKLMAILNDIEACAMSGRDSELERLFAKLDDSFKKLHENPYFRVFIKPMGRVQLELQLKSVQRYRFHKNISEKGLKVVQAYRNFLLECNRNHSLIYPAYCELKKKINGID